MASSAAWVLPTEHSFLEKLAGNLQETVGWGGGILSSVRLGLLNSLRCNQSLLLLLAAGVCLLSLWVSQRTRGVTTVPKPVGPRNPSKRSSS